MKMLGKHIKIALFCGGRGSATIIQELLRWSNVQLTLIVNAYDDGLSTGALRGFIAEMLGPSDFRKNLSYLLDPHSKKQYALKQLLEFRLPAAKEEFDHKVFFNFIKTGKVLPAIAPIGQLFEELDYSLATRIKRYLLIFFKYAEEQQELFDFRDCSLGNLIFAGAYLDNDKNFNAAAKEMSHLVSSRGLLVNVSRGENRILVGLKSDGTILASEAEIVGEQSSIAIENIFLVPKLALPDHALSFEEKKSWLAQQEVIPQISPEAINAIEEADIILYGPGTQHSSLFPSYRIAHHYLKNAAAPVKAFVMNLETDFDIQAFSASDILDRALIYLEDPHNSSRVFTHVLLNNVALEKKIPSGNLVMEKSYKNMELISNAFVNPSNKHHNGHAIVETVLSLFEKSTVASSSIDIFIDIHKRSLAASALSDEFLEMDWQSYFAETKLVFNQIKQKFDSSFIETVNYTSKFPEVEYFLQWLTQGQSEYLVLLTGDGEYRFRDVMLSLRLLEQSNFAVVLGSRTQSRLQFKVAMQAAYGENKFLGWLSAWAARLMSVIYTLRFGVVFSDPLTGFRIFKRSRLLHLINDSTIEKAKTPIAIIKCLLHHKIEIAELPVNYRTFSGFTDSRWRIRRGIKNLLSLLV